MVVDLALPLEPGMVVAAFDRELHDLPDRGRPAVRLQVEHRPLTDLDLPGVQFSGEHAEDLVLVEEHGAAVRQEGGEVGRQFAELRDLRLDHDLPRQEPSGQSRDGILELGGGILGIYMLGFLTRRGNGKSVAFGIVCTAVFSLYITLCEMEVIHPAMLMNHFSLSEDWARFISRPMHTYYAGLFGHILMFVVAYASSRFFERAPRDLTNLTVWTTSRLAEEE